jgi:endonuclease VIII
MPEGPSLVILREQAQIFAGKRVVAVEGNSKIDSERMVGQRIVSLRTWGKHFLIEFTGMPATGFTLRIHLLMFGRYCINERKPDKPIRLGLRFPRKQELNFYACAARYVEGDLDDSYDWSADVMSDLWDPAAARKKLRAMPETLVCDALLDQNVFAGVGNIIKNEVLYRIKVHPCSKLGALPPAKLNQMVEEARNYSFQFLEWKKAFVLRKHWLVHNKGVCPRCEIKLTRDYLGVTNRRSFFCERCQIRYAPPRGRRKTPKRGFVTIARP